MCGIAGLIDGGLRGEGERLTQAVLAMSDAIRHRGPDAGGVWIDADSGLGLGHRRLSIVDLSAAGAQPMVSADGRWVIVYNGEVYNSAELRAHAALGGVAWRGHSDTEAIVESIARRGLEATLDDLNGMFAFAIFDRSCRELHLVRDRLGIKPLFWSVDAGRLLFASELKAFTALGPRDGSSGFQPAIDEASVASFLRFGYVPAPHSIYRGVRKLEPGAILTIVIDNIGPGFDPHPRRYWSLGDAATRGFAAPLDVPDGEAIELLAGLLADAVSRQMMGDVPIGAFLSGGIDSSTVAALMVAAGHGQVRTFAIGFPDLGFDESMHAAAVAAHLGTQHTRLEVSGAEALSVVPQLAEMYDEPFADSSQIPTHLVSKLTRGYVTVALSGDGGDELFAGYNRYLMAEQFSRTVARAPVALRQGLGAMLGAIPGTWVDGAAGLAPARFRPPQAGDKLGKIASVLALDEQAFYWRLVSQCPDPALLMPGVREHPLPSWPSDGRGAPMGQLEAMQFLDTQTYLPDDILQKVDRASMAVALEARPPLLDHRVVEFAWRLPRRFKIRNGETKWLLRRVLDRHVPRTLIDRPKMGFGIPLSEWLRGPLRPWADDLLDRRRLGGGLIDTTVSDRMWAEHLSGRRNWAYALWTLLMFEAWRRRWTA